MRGMAFFLILYDESVKRYKEIKSGRIAPAHVQSVVLVSKHYLLKALIQFSRNRESCYNSFYFIFYVLFHFAMYLVQAEPSKLAIFILWPNYRRKA